MNTSFYRTLPLAAFDTTHSQKNSRTNKKLVKKVKKGFPTDTRRKQYMWKQLLHYLSIYKTDRLSKTRKKKKKKRSGHPISQIKKYYL